MPTFWNETKLEPFRGFRWKIQFSGIKEMHYAMKVEKPSFKVGEYAHKYINHTFFFPGRVEWNPITCTIVDVPNGAAINIFQNMKQGGYIAPGAKARDGSDGLTKAAHTQAHANAGMIKIYQMGPADPGAVADDANATTHKSIQTYELHNAWIQDIKFGSLDYSNEDAVTIDMTIRYDYAIVGSAG